MPMPAPGASSKAGNRRIPAGLDRRYRHERWAAVAAALLLALVLLLSGALEPIEDRLTEARAQVLDRSPTGEIAIVEIDAKSLAAINKWPWSRRYHADLVDRLHAAGASMIAFDVDFSARSDADGDTAFARALARAQPVILPIFQQHASDNPNDRLMIRNRPAPPFRQSWVGGVNILPDRDGIVRTFPAATMVDRQIQPAMAVLLSDNDRLGDRVFAPDWSIDAARIPRLSFIDVLNGRVGSDAIKGKRIIVGATAIELGDRYTIPRFGTVPGVVVQALAAESLIQHRAISRSGMLPAFIGLALLSLLFAAPFANPMRALPLLTGGVLVALTMMPFALQARWPVSMDSAALLVATAVNALLRLLVEARHRRSIDALHDVETGLPNRRALEVALSETSARDLALTAAAIDRFTDIRSVVGSSAAGTLVAQVAARIEAALGTIVYRLTSDTLAWVGPAGDEAERLARTVAGCFDDAVTVDGAPIDVRLMFGMAAAVGCPTPAVLAERALATVNSARSEGRKRQWFQGVAPGALRELSMASELRRAIAEGQLFVAYQPKLDLKSRSITHAEALVRWRHPTEGLIPPDRFVPIAEASGAVRELTRFVLRSALSEQTGAHRAGSLHGLSINVSAHDLSEPAFADEVIEALRGSQLQPAQLTLEITESAIIRSRETALQVLHALRGHGIRLSIDDYGTGQSTLSYLQSLPVDELKIDKSFVTHIGSNVNDRIMVRSTIEMAHELGLSVVAEGVESWETVSVLGELNCDYAQGFAIGRALSFEQLQAAAADRPLRKVA